MKSKSVNPTTDQQGQRGAFPLAAGSGYVMHAYVRGERREILETLTPAMWECLYNACWKSAPRRNRSTLAALEARGLMKDGKITPAGIDAQLVVWKQPSPNAADVGRAGNEPSTTEKP